ncbi:hypothetical protein [Streptomyces sp. NPDC058964]|uniref:hypothetical protein n=1 Tax=Streptomyces sp. NPDC058964 TaxID=3346681 RepID=UPI003697C15E
MYSHRIATAVPEPAARHGREAELLQRAESLRERAHQAQRALLAVNGVPFAAGIVLSSFTDVPSIPVQGRLTLGLVWGVLQIGLFVTTACLYEVRCTRSCDALEHSLASDIADAGRQDARPSDGFEW